MRKQEEDRLGRLRRCGGRGRRKRKSTRSAPQLQTTLTTPGVPVAEQPGGIQLEATQAGSVNEIPITESGVIARLKEMVGGRVGGEGLDCFPLIHEARQLRDEVALHFVPENPDDQACAGRGHADWIGGPIDVEMVAGPLYEEPLEFDGTG
ncbi:hypothetical protein NPIL_462531 [Nephila pilipes]|uniref:Uncharacterized protein n=1 Tax=Nephila pilipes TaxID=299642 RepID=A0A8X6MEW8_NEPPI|nr:hypothetical protein NPIL_462531 [Nephila pilipes]